MNDINTTDMEDFRSWVMAIKTQIRATQIKASIKVNSELLRLYWSLGKQIILKEKNSCWGDRLLYKLSSELLTDFPSMKGFSERNLINIRKWYSFYSKEDTITKQLVSQLGDNFFMIPWGHHLYILSHARDINEAAFYLGKVLTENWSRRVLLNMMSTNLYNRAGKAVTNFASTLPIPQGELAQQITKDPYVFDIMELTEHYHETELEKALEENITKFLLELGKGFAYVGRQIPMVIGEDTIYADLLFYNIELHCYIVIELKAGKFKPEYIGQLSAYVSATDHLKRGASDAPTIGLLICKSKNNILARWTLENICQPIGVSSYELSQVLPDEIMSSLPSIEEIKANI